MKISFKKLNEKAVVPTYGSKDSAGADIRACIDHEIVISPGGIAVVSTGIAVEIPENFFGMMCPRSGLAVKNGITLLNSPGIIDSDYRGELRMVLINHSDKHFTVEDEMRMAQLIVVPFVCVDWVESVELSKTNRGSGGFGSTGVK
ncbi:MAG: dUTP diphosphatase [Holosporales bacterium]|nr:dUTP diphosphatase [Holosporales bacterium]